MKNRLYLLQAAAGFLLLFLGCTYSRIAFADDNGGGFGFDVSSVSDILNNIANNSIPGLYKFATSFAFLIGIWFIYRALYELRKYGELRTMMRVDTNLMKPMTLFFAGIVLIYWHAGLDVVMETVFATNSPLSYQEAGVGGSYDDIMKPLVIIIQFIGFIAFIRGMVLLTSVAEQGSASQGILSKALAHIIGGILAFNIYGTWQVISNTMFKGG
ncbi:MAG: type IV secretion protein IcmC [Gammaproteobacteria bacterium]|nr:type IV secretion protein IcmC [Gammaproteobacteria bacterium]